jgi:hypothetical protein
MSIRVWRVKTQNRQDCRRNVGKAEVHTYCSTRHDDDDDELA